MRSLLIFFRKVSEWRTKYWYLEIYLLKCGVASLGHCFPVYGLTRSFRNVWNQLPSDTAPHPRRSETWSMLVRETRSPWKFVMASLTGVRHRNCSMKKDRYPPLVCKVGWELCRSTSSFILVFRVQIVVLLTKVLSIAVISQAAKDGLLWLKSGWRYSGKINYNYNYPVNKTPLERSGGKVTYSCDSKAISQTRPNVI